MEALAEVNNYRLTVMAVAMGGPIFQLSVGPSFGATSAAHRTAVAGEGAARGLDGLRGRTKRGAPQK